MRPVGNTLLRVLLGGIFVYASIDKIIDPAAFARAIDNYQMLPSMLIPPAAMILPWVEAVCGAALISGRGTAGAALIVSILMAAFIAAFSINLARGLDVNCGCFSLASKTASSAPVVLTRDVALLTAGLWLFIVEIRKESSEA